RGAKQISEGELDTNVEITSGDELEELGDVLNEMSSRLSESFRNLTRQRKDLNAVLSSINDGIIAIGPDKKAVFHNEIAVKLFNLVSKDIEGKYYYDLFLNKHLVSLIDRFFEESFVLSDEITLEDNRIL
ncbi:MAG: HAMP domain-containing protein, partial [Aliifodinibius sp.]|nr:HAMP domain-containing protein [Fodinibius sp.]